MSRRENYDTQGVGVEGDDHPLHRGMGLAYSKMPPKIFTFLKNKTKKKI